MITVRVYHYMINYRAKQKHLLLFHVTDEKLREVLQKGKVMINQRKWILKIAHVIISMR